MDGGGSYRLFAACMVGMIELWLLPDHCGKDDGPNRGGMFFSLVCCVSRDVDVVFKGPHLHVIHGALGNAVR